MKRIENQTFQGERPLFKSNGILIRGSAFLAGESALKESTNVEAENCNFIGKYPFWHDDGVKIRNCVFTEDSRAAIWYSKNLTMSQCRVDAPKMFRECDVLSLTDVKLNADECGWHCRGVTMENVEAAGNYLLLSASDLKINGLKLIGNYPLQYVKNSEIHNASLQSKDCLWNTENVTVYDSELNGEYLAWYSKNLTLIRCRIRGTQPLCYAENLTMENCEMIDTDLCFEYTNVNATITGEIDSIKNPVNSRISAQKIHQIIFDDPRVDASKSEIILEP